ANAAIISLGERPPVLTVVAGGVQEPVVQEPVVQEPAAETTSEVASPTPAAPAAPAGPPFRLELGGRPHGSHRSGDPEWHGERFSNATHRSATDPEARLYRKSNGQEAQLRYLGHYLADLRSGVI